MTWAALGAVPDVETTQYRVPLPSFVLTEPVAAVEPLAASVGEESVGAVTSAVVKPSPEATADCTAEAFSCMKWI